MGEGSRGGAGLNEAAEQGREGSRFRAGLEAGQQGTGFALGERSQKGRCRRRQGADHL